MGEPATLPPMSWPEAAGSSEQDNAPVTVPLSELAHARSGDKGDMANIGVIARAPAVYPWLAATLSATLVKEYFTDICLGEVERHEVPNLAALNFLLGESLGGGGTVSLRLDAQGKTLSHALLALPVRVPRALLAAARQGGNEHRTMLGLGPLADVGSRTVTAPADTAAPASKPRAPRNKAAVGSSTPAAPAPPKRQPRAPKAT